MITAQQLESGDNEAGLTGRLGAGTGKWTLDVSSEEPIQVMGLLLSEDGNLSNLSRSPYEPHRAPTDCDEGYVSEGADNGGRTLDSASDLGDLTEVAVVRVRSGEVDRTINENGYYRFTLNDTRRIRVELRNLTRNADLQLLNSVGDVLSRHDGSRGYSAQSTNEGTRDESIVWPLDAGTYYIHVEAATTSTRTIDYLLRYGPGP